MCSYANLLGAFFFLCYMYHRVVHSVSVHDMDMHGEGVHKA
jgi:hypothetical protein